MAIPFLVKSFAVCFTADVALMARPAPARCCHAGLRVIGRRGNLELGATSTERASSGADGESGALVWQQAALYTQKGAFSGGFVFEDPSEEAAPPPAE